MFLAVSRKSDNVNADDLIIVNGSQGYYEMDFSVPDGVPGGAVSLSLQFSYATGDPRPVLVSLNGGAQSTACHSATGGWDTSALTQETVGPLIGLGGGATNVLRIETNNLFFPHVHRISVAPP